MPPKNARGWLERGVHQPLVCNNNFLRNRQMEHPDAEVRAAIIRLDDALCTYERACSRESVFILREADFVHRAVSGKPDVYDDITDAQLIKNILG